MKATSADRVVSRPRFTPPFENGDVMDRKTFHALYEQCPPGFKAELIGGVVHLPSPTKYRHSKPHTWAALWLGNYTVGTPGTEPLVEITNVIDGDNEPQPDVILRVLPEYGGQTTDTAEGYMGGAAELVVEVASTSAAIDLGAKRREYETAGVKEYVVALAGPREVRWFARGRKGFADLPPGDDGIFRSRVFPGLWLEPAALFERSPARVMTALQAGLASPEHATFVAKLAAHAAKPKPRKPKS